MKTLAILAGIVVTAVLLLGLPLAGVVAAGKPLAQYAEFPPLTRYVQHADFSSPVFIALTLAILAVVGPFVLRVLRANISHPFCVMPTQPRRFPAFGVVGLAIGVAAWILAWNRFEWFSPYQQFTFTPLWISYILVVNALTFRRTGRCMITDRPRYFLLLFPASAAFWWFFEYLNRFVQNWYYEGIGDLSGFDYFVFATLPFSTVLPAVLGTCELLESYPKLSYGLGSEELPSPKTSPACGTTGRGAPDTLTRPAGAGHPLPQAGEGWGEGDFKPVGKFDKPLAAATLTACCVGLAGIGIWPDYLFPLLWLSPVFIITSLQTLAGRETIFSPIRRGDWQRICLLALGALICGFFWEMWNFRSLAKWKYAVPFVNRFHLYEMPILGFAGYLPFGLECAVIGDAVAGMIRAPAADSRVRRIATALCAILAAGFIWLSLVHIFFRPNLPAYFDNKGIPPKAVALAASQLELWSNPELRAEEIRKMRGSNAEWDFMSRTYFVLSLANMAIREPASRAQYLGIMDTIIDETVRLEKQHGIYYFLMDYAQDGLWRASQKRSLFEDGEIALMLAARRLVEEKPDYKPALSERVNYMVSQMSESPVLSGESYPNECWMFCNTVALAAIRISDVLDGTDHSEFIRRWIETAKAKLTDSKTGILWSSYSFDGMSCDGPEGSSIWMVAHCLQVVDREFAEDQYRRAKKELSQTLLGFGYAKEWPESWKGPADVDSGPIIPFIEISAGSSGLAFVGAASFDDKGYLSSLLTSLNFGGFPVERKGRLRYCASNQVGDAVLLYAMVLGPLWKKVENHSCMIQ